LPAEDLDGADIVWLRIDQIDSRMPDLEDWELLLALHLDRAAWDGLITTDRQPVEPGADSSACVRRRPAI